jgi:hypothetical protein
MHRQKVLTKSVCVKLFVITKKCLKRPMGELYQSFNLGGGSGVGLFDKGRVVFSGIWRPL